MLKKILASGILIAAIFGVGMAPQIFLSQVPVREYVHPASEAYQKSVSATGKFQPNYAREVYLEAPVIANKVNISIGDVVKKGETLAEIDTNLTKSILEDSILVKMQMAQEVWKSPEVEKLAEVYGISDEALSGISRNPSDTVQAVSKSQNITVPSKILAPISGVVTGMNFSSNVLTQTSLPIITIAENSSMKILFEVSENDVQYIKLGNKVRVTSDAAAETEYWGEVIKIYPSAEISKTVAQKESVIPVEVLIDTPDVNLKSGFTAKGSIQVGDIRSVISLPYEAIGQDENNQEYVYVFERGRAVRKNILTGSEMLHSVEIIAGISLSDRILISPDEIQNNQLVLSKPINS